MKLLFRKTISSWTMTGLLGKGARWFLGLSILPSTGASSETWVLSSEYYQLKDELAQNTIQLGKLKDELETERMRLAACGVVAMSDTWESIAKSRNTLPEYNSASCEDVARRVEEVIRLREDVATLRENNLKLATSNLEVLGVQQEKVRSDRNDLIRSALYTEGQQYIVCAAARNTYNGAIICSPRHYASTFHAAIELYRETADEKSIEGWRESDEGFVDQFGKFLTRAEARKIAVATNQIRRRCGGDHEELYSENLY